MGIPNLLRVDWAVTKFPGRNGKSVHLHTFKRWLKKNGIPIIKMGRDCYITEESIVDLVARSTGGGK